MIDCMPCMGTVHRLTAQLYKVYKVSADVMSSGRLFQILCSATEKARVPTVDNLTGGM